MYCTEVLNVGTARRYCMGMAITTAAKRLHPQRFVLNQARETVSASNADGWQDHMASLVGQMSATVNQLLDAR